MDLYDIHVITNPTQHMPMNYNIKFSKACLTTRPLTHHLLHQSRYTHITHSNTTHNIVYIYGQIIYTTRWSWSRQHNRIQRPNHNLCIAKMTPQLTKHIESGTISHTNCTKNHMVTPPRCTHTHRQPQEHLPNKRPHKPPIVSTPTPKQITHISHSWPNTKVRAHTGTIGNERADQLATKAQLWQSYGKIDPHTMYTYHPYCTILAKWHPNRITWRRHLSPTSLRN